MDTGLGQAPEDPVLDQGQVAAVQPGNAQGDLDAGGVAEAGTCQTSSSRSSG